MFGEGAALCVQPFCSAAGLPFTGDLRAGRHCRDPQLRISAPRGPGWPARPSRPRHFQLSYPCLLLLVPGVAPPSSGSRNSLMPREDRIPLLGTDPPWSPVVLQHGRRAQLDVHLKGARWYLTCSRTSALLPCSLCPGESRRVQPPDPPAQSPSAPLKPWLLRSRERSCAEGIPALLSGGALFARGVPLVFRAPRAPGKLRTQDVRLPTRFSAGFRVVEPVGGRRAGVTRGTPLPVGHPREGAARRAGSTGSEQEVSVPTLGGRPAPRGLGAVRWSIRPPVPQCGDRSREGGREAGVGIGEAPSTTPPPTGQSEAAGGAAARLRLRRARPGIRGQVSLPAPRAGRRAARSGRDARRSGVMSVSRKSWAALSR